MAPELEFTSTEQIKIVVFSFILGLIFGLLYDIIRIVNILSGVLSFSDGKTEQKKGAFPYAALIFSDGAYMLAVTAVFSVFVYAVNNGDFRWFIAGGCALGCAAYHATLGRFVVLVSGTVANAVRTAIRYAVIKPVKFIVKCLCRAAVFAWRMTVGRIFGLVRTAARERRARALLGKIKKDIRFT